MIRKHQSFTRKVITICTLIALAGLLGSVPLQAQRTRVLRFMSEEAGDPETMKVYRQQIDEYQAQHPDIKIVIEPIPAGESSIVLYAQLAARSAPDIAGVDPEDLASLAEEGLVMPVEGVIEDIGYDEYNPQGFIQYKGHIWNLPHSVDALVLWLRKDLMAQYGVKAPETWDEWLEYSKKLHLDTNGDGKIDIYGSLVPLGMNDRIEWFMHDLMWATGKSMFDEDFNFQFDSSNGVQVLKFLKDLEEFSPPGNVNYSWYDTIDAFTTGKAAWCAYPGRVLGVCERTNPDLVSKITAVLYPKGPVLRAWSVAYNSYCITADTKQLKLAKDFVKFLITGERLVDFCLTTPGHSIPPIKSLTDHAKILNHPLLNRFPKITETLMAAGTEYGGIYMAKETGAIKDGKIVPGKINPYRFAVVSEMVLAKAAQKHMIQGISAEEVVEWAGDEVERIKERVEARWNR